MVWSGLIEADQLAVVSRNTVNPVSGANKSRSQANVNEIVAHRQSQVRQDEVFTQV